jgi:hypothetical protein
MRPAGSSIVTFLIAAALALSACGGDDEGNGATTGATAGDDGVFTTNTGGTTATTETGATEKEGTGTTREDRTTTSERGDDKGGRDRGGSGSGGSGRGSDDSGRGSQPAAQPGDVYKVARTVCKDFLPKIIARDLQKGDKSPEEVARDYSRGFPGRQQRRAYEGCLAGVKARG